MRQQDIHTGRIGHSSSLHLFVLMLPLTVTASLSSASNDQSRVAAPSPELEPADVVRIQVDALRNNNPRDEGIELTYRFASPENKRVTGPLARFTEMVHSNPYDRLLNHLGADYEPLEISGNKAYQLVNITDTVGEVISYHWILVRLSEGQFKDCWMTDAVIATERPTQRILTLFLIPDTQANNDKITGSNPAQSGRGYVF